MPESFFCKVAGINEETLGQVFSCEFCEISKNSFFIEHLRVTASEKTSKTSYVRSMYILCPGGIAQ